MPTNVQLSSQQLQTLSSLRTQAESLGNAVGAWAPFYNYLACVIRNGVVDRGTAEVTAADIALIRGAGLLPTESLQSLVWLIGGAAVNANSGVFSQIIRQYNIQQGRLRGFNFSEADLQRASNEVGRRMGDQILGNEDSPGNGGMVPTVSEIGSRDLEGVRDVLYPGNDTSGSPMFLNQAWPGIIMLGAQGEDFLGRLLQPNTLEGPVEIDSLGDIQNLLFAWESFRYAFSATGVLDSNFIRDVAIYTGVSNVDQVVSTITSLPVGRWAQGMFDVLIQGQNQLAGAALRQIHDIGSERFLDMVMGALQGQSLVGTTTQANFEATARGFFTSFSSERLQSLGIELLPPGASTLAARAATDVNVRAALAALSIVSVQVEPDVAARFSLYDLATGLGDITSSWITDRAAMTSRVAAAGWSNTAVITGQGNTRYADLATGAQVLLGAVDNNILRQQIVFGSDAAETLTGYGFSDHLYGGADNDTLSGQGGDDWLEGQSGNDNLDGGAGNDNLLGGSGVDRLDGGDADDLLRGGAGADVYRFAGAFGDDVIEDGDASGSIEVGSLGELGSNTVRLSDTTWQSADGRVRYVRMPTAQADRFDLIITVAAAADSGTITVRNWSSGDLGIHMPTSPAQGTFVTTLYGDFIKETTSDGLYNIVDANYVAAGASPGAQDLMRGRAQADQLYGLGGSDALYGDAGDDLLDGGDGNDLLLGGDGQDTLVGGGGNDVVVGSGRSYIYQPTSPSYQPLAVYAAQYEFARGLSWVVYQFGVGSDDFESEFVGAGVNSFQPSDYRLYDSGNVIDAGAGDDVIFAGTGADFVSAGEDSDRVVGMGGADTISGDGGDDSIWGDGAEQTGYASATPLEDHGSDVIVGGAGNDHLYGQGGDDRLFGGNDDDLIYGDDQNLARTPPTSHGNDDLDGGFGADQLLGGGLNDRLSGGAGDDLLWGDDTTAEPIDAAHHGSDTLEGGDGNDYLEGGARNDVLLGGADNDTLLADGRVFESAEYGADYLDGGTGDDGLEGGGGADTLFGGAGNDVLDGDSSFTAIAANDQGNDYLSGDEGSDALSGQGGNDTLDGGGGVDASFGGAGDDFYHLRYADIAQIDGLTEYIDDALGNNVVSFEDVSTSSLQAAQLASGNSLFLNFGAGVGIGISAGTLPASRFQFVDQMLSGAQLVGRYLNGSITSYSDAGVSAYGGRGAETISTAADRATISGGLGNDLLIGGGGGNRYIYEVGDGADTIRDGSVVSGVRGAAGSSRIAFGGIISIADLSISISEQSIDIRVGAGNADLIRIEGFNLTESTAPAPVSLLEFSNGTTFDLESYTRQDFISIGTNDNDLIFSGAGNDTIDGGIGSDALYGRGGSDSIVGGEGEDRLFGDTGNDVLNGGSGRDMLYGGDGDDVLYGGDEADALYGHGGNDVMVGGAGNDDLNDGHASNDIYRFSRGDGVDRITDSDGADQIELVDRNAADVVSVRRSGYHLNIALSGGDSISVRETFGVTGAVDTRWAVERIIFEDGISWDISRLLQEALRSTSGADIIFAFDTDDTIDGAEGDDYLGGAGGNDRLIGNFGIDQLEGGDGNDTLEGGSGDDRLSGDGGDDVLVGGTGNDVVFDTSDSSNDIYRISRGDGIDSLTDYGGAEDRIEFAGQNANDVFSVRVVDYMTIISFSSGDVVTLNRVYDFATGQFVQFSFEEIHFADGTVWDVARLRSESLRGTVEADIISGTTSDDVISGGDGDDTLSGQEGADLLVGGGGADLLHGGEGDDVLSGGIGNDSMFDASLSSSDTYRFARGEGADLLRDSGGAIDRIEFTGLDVVDVVRVLSDGRSVLIDFGNADSLTIEGMFDGAGGATTQAIESIRFADGTTWSSAVLQANARLGGTYGNDAIGGTSGDDVILSLSGDDWVRGEAGNDVLDGGIGRDTLFGGAGNDTFVVDDAADVIVENSGEGIDTVESSITWALESNVERLVLTGFTALNGTGNSLDNVLTGNGADNTLNGAVGADNMAGGGGNDVYIVDNLLDVVNEAASEGIDRVESSVSHVLGANVENLTLTGSAVANASGNASANVLLGNAGANRLDGGAGIDTMTGGAGNDTYVVGDAGDLVVEAASGGTDTIESSLTWTLASEVENLTLTGSDAINGSGNALANTLRGNVGNNVLSGLTGNDTMIGGAGDDVYVVDAAADVVTENTNEGTDSVQSSVTWALANNVENLTLTGVAAVNSTGNGLNNTLVGNSAANTLNGGLGADTMDGGAGDDVYVVDNTLDVVTEASNQGADRIESSVTYMASGHVENLTLTGTGSINATGNELVNTLIGNAGNNRLDGGAGVDTMTGGAGNDTYVVDAAGDTTTEFASGGTDTVEASLTWSLTAEVENLTLTGAVSINGSGNGLANTLRGNAGNNVLNGLAGNDTMIGGAGDDTYVVDATADVVTENASEGTDLIQSSVTWTLGSNVESLTLTGTSALIGTGNSLANALVGNSAANTLNGGSGADTMTGGAGDDIYVVDNILDVVVETAGQGTDRIDSTVTYAVSAQVENLTLTGASSINATGNELANTLIGNAGNNRLDGGAGADAMTGGAGNDVYVVDVAGDTAVEAASGGTDTVEASLSWTLGNQLENLTLTGTAALNATGNALANTLRGNAGNNVLSGLAGNDTMIGGAGDDTYIVDVTTDVLTENASEGIDSVQSALTWTLGNNLENLTLTGTAAVNGTGNTLDNVLTGNSANNTLTSASGNDTLDGGTGNDTMVGGTGNDTYFANVAADVVTENANEGTDTVNSAVAWTLGNNLENLTLTGTSAINGTGNTLNNVMTGNSAANTLTAGAGNDTLDGGAGNDTMLGGAGDDVYMVSVAMDVVTENVNEGTDTIRSDVSWTLANNFENLTLTGTGVVNATGNAVNNVLIGNGANNTLTGNGGNDTLEGFAGSDTLIGGTGNDTYVLGRGYGAESVQENDATSGNTDVMQFLSGVTTDQIWLRRVSNDLEVSIIGTSDQATLSNWYLGNQYHVEQFRTSDGKVLLDSQVQNLVNAMASFAPPAAGQTTLPPSYQTSLAPTIAANWAG